jgi:hypothetical protein
MFTFDEISISGVQNGVEHALEEQEVAHPLGHKDVELSGRQVRREIQIFQTSLEYNRMTFLNVAQGSML